MGSCKYCGQSGSKAGSLCSKSPTKTHVVNNGPRDCIYCGNPSVKIGSYCTKSPTGGHVVGS